MLHVLAAEVSSNAKIAIAIGLIVFIVLFFKLIVGFIKFCFRHPFIFIILLICGGLGFGFNFLLGGIIVIAALVGGVVFWLLNEFNQ
ncbi:hypothetical protein IV38_GL000046 [Lactobacillus selangorensis]|uniref:Uncharacterized protein n=2 Tax=Lactobacillus selangorensis TaxID=81857 RepID=A0A0R2FST4_9LACO|nr:hypothetical protein IV38_GL000046 [Lactobacillus selangorensis]KRN31474.1 hypothetical protein IV40_GL001472 [Lactobacillus selangorensis]